MRLFLTYLLRFGGWGPASGYVLYLAWRTVQPLVFLLTVGILIDSIATVQQVGQATRLIALLCLLYIGDQLIERVGQPFLSRLSWKMDQGVKRVLVAAALRPATIEHIESERGREDFSIASGELTGRRLGQAIQLLASLASTRGAGALFILYAFRIEWWAPITLLVGSYALRRWIVKDVKAYEAGFDEAFADLRRGAYFRDLAFERRAAKEIRVFNLSQWVLNTFSREVLNGLSIIWKARASSRAIMFASVGIMVLSMYPIARAIVFGALSGDLSLGSLAVYLQVVFGSLRIVEAPELEYSLSASIKGLPRLQALSERLNAQEQQAEGRSIESTGVGDIDLVDVHFRYPGTEREILNGINLKIPYGSFTAITGWNGAGKSTVLKLLTGLYQPTQGRIEVNGVSLRQLDIDSWRRSIAYVGQDFVRWEMTLRDNLSMGFPHLMGNDELLTEALRDAGIGSLLDKVPDGLDTVLAPGINDGAELSGGEWQKVAFARALVAIVGGAQYLLLDEPTASLDANAEAEFKEWVLRVRNRVTIIAISHRLSTIVSADQVVVIDGGIVSECGAHQDLIEAGGVYSKMFSFHADAYQSLSEGLRPV